MTRFSVLLLWVLAFANLQALAQPGSAGMPLLKLGVDARTIAGGYVSALSDGPSSVSMNPAGLEPLSPNDATAHVTFSHQEWIQDTRTEFLAASAPVSTLGTAALSLLTTTVSGIEIRTRPGPPEGTFTARDLALGLSFATHVGTNITAGATARFLYQDMFVNEATGYSFDAGVRFLLPVEGLEAGAALMNVGRMTVLQLERTTLPSLLRFGGAYRGEMPDDLSYTVGADIVRNLPEKRFYGNVGGEVSFRKWVALRVGNEFGSDARGFTAGLGVAYGILTLDYALGALRQDLGTAHTFTLGLVL